MGRCIPPRLGALIYLSSSEIFSIQSAPHATSLTKHLHHCSGTTTSLYAAHHRRRAVSKSGFGVDSGCMQHMQLSHDTCSLDDAIPVTAQGLLDGTCNGNGDITASNCALPAEQAPSLGNLVSQALVFKTCLLITRNFQSHSYVLLTLILCRGLIVISCIVSSVVCRSGPNRRISLRFCAINATGRVRDELLTQSLRRADRRSSSPVARPTRPSAGCPRRLCAQRGPSCCRSPHGQSPCFWAQKTTQQRVIGRRKSGRRGTARCGAGDGMQYHLPRAVRAVCGNAGRLLPVLPASVHAQHGVEEPRHGGDEAEGEDGAPDVAISPAPRETPDPSVPQATTATTQLRTKLGFPHDLHPNEPLGQAARGRGAGGRWGRTNVHSSGVQRRRST